MLRECDYSQALLEQVNQAISDKTPLVIQGSNSKAFLGRPVTGQTLDVRCHRGIVNYDPTELVITARVGTPLVTIEAALESAGQMLPCEPPHYGEEATWGGMVACGLAGPRRPWSGSVRDFVLGTRIITGAGKHLRFGGEVMKNVAGYDLSRLMVGSYGCLGVLTEISMKVLPRPRASLSLRREISLQEAMSEIAEWQLQPLPISGLCYFDNALWIRLEGGEGSVKAARELLGGEEVAGQFWQQLREQQLPFFSLPGTLWRISLPSDAPMMDLPGEQLIDWGGALRWLKSTAEDNQIHRIARNAGGHATRFSAGDGGFAPLSAPLFRYHQQLKQQLDPCGVFNPGRMYANFEEQAMQTQLTEEMRQNARALEADSILRACVHCGFCTATCPTYQLLGDELDGPRGRIYLIKQVLEGNEVTLKTQEHLDRCLTCRNCETTCPSGVRYHNLLDIGRDIVEQKVKRPLPERILREGLRQVVPRPAVFRALTQVGLVLRPFLPEQVRAKLPAETVKAKPRPPLRHKRRVLMLEGCAQPTLSPNTNAATARVLDRLGISVMSANEAGCCGAVDYHLNAQEKGLARARNNIDAWWPAIEAGAEAILQTASGCGAFVKEYGQMLKNDALYADKARQVSELAVDLVELLREEPLEKTGNSRR